jgi:RNA polymerase sigma-70 factor (ECF subfamily)
MEPTALTPISRISDAQLLSRYVQAGEVTAINELFERYQDFAYRVALRRLGNETDAEDVVQQSFIKVTQLTSQFTGEGSVKVWLGVIVMNMAGNLIHVRMRRKRLEKPWSRKSFGRRCNQARKTGKNLKS